jgi:hypothetical protein
MPGYGLLGPEEGAGLLPWSWAEQRLRDSRDYWVATVRADGPPHLMPVWAVLIDDALWFSSSPGSAKARNLAVRPVATVATDNPQQPVVVEGPVVRVADRAALEAFATATNAKYETAIEVAFYEQNACFRLTIARAFGLDEADFTGSPTRWTFG